MRLYFIRHAQSENNALWDRTGSDSERKEDPLLTDLGKVQARRVAQFVKECHDPQEGKHAQQGLGITHLYCSPMYRAAATAYQIGTALQILPEVWVDWHECGGMFLENKVTKEKESRSGMNQDEMEIHFPGIVMKDDIGKDGWWNKGWEIEENRPIRARRVLRELLDRHLDSDDKVAVVSHGAFYTYFVAALLNLEKIKPVWFLMNNTGISRIEFLQSETTFVFHNFLGHLTHEFIS